MYISSGQYLRTFYCRLTCQVDEVAVQVDLEAKVVVAVVVLIVVQVTVEVEVDQEVAIVQEHLSIATVYTSVISVCLAFRKTC